MNREEWLTIIIREANRFVREHDHALREAWARDKDISSLGRELDDHVHQVMQDQEMLETEDLWGLIRHSNLQSPPAYLWKDADEWQSVVVRVAYACFAYDLGYNVEQILAGNLPKVDPGQMIFRPPAGGDEDTSTEGNGGAAGA
jgi:hypothetical protein